MNLVNYCPVRCYPGILLPITILKGLGSKASIFYYGQTETHSVFFVLCANKWSRPKEKWEIANLCLSYLWLLCVNVLFTYNITTGMLLSAVDTKLFIGNYPKFRLTWPQLFLILSLLIWMFPLCSLVLCNCLWCLLFWQLVWICLFINKKYYSALLCHMLLILNLKNLWNFLFK